MVFEPVDALENRIATRERRFKRHRMTRQNTALFIDTGLESTMPGSQLQ